MLLEGAGGTNDFHIAHFILIFDNWGGEVGMGKRLPHHRHGLLEQVFLKVTSTTEDEIIEMSCISC